MQQTKAKDKPFNKHQGIIKSNAGKVKLQAAT
jgi:hypothetical protein